MRFALRIDRLPVLRDAVRACQHDRASVRSAARQIAKRGSQVSDASVECARSALSQGDVLVAYDEAMEVLEVRPDDREAQFVAALALARSLVSHAMAKLAIAHFRRNVRALLCRRRP